VLLVAPTCQTRVRGYSGRTVVAARPEATLLAEEWFAPNQSFRQIPKRRDYERDPAVSEALIRWAAINTMVRRLDRGRPAVRQTRPTLSTPG
jgi:hypothetical protein